MYHTIKCVSLSKSLNSFKKVQNHKSITLVGPLLGSFRVQLFFHCMRNKTLGKMLKVYVSQVLKPQYLQQSYKRNISL